MATLLQDLFTDSDSTALTAHTMDVGAGWTADNGICTIQNNTAAPPTATANVVASADSGQADVVVTVDCIVPNVMLYVLGISVRTTDSNNTWFGVIERDAGTPYLAIYERSSGSTVLRSSTNISGATGTTVGITCTTSGNSITLTASTSESCNYGSASVGNTRTRHGLNFFTDFGYSDTCRLDNFLVTGSSASTSYSFSSTIPLSIMCF